MILFFFLNFVEGFKEAAEIFAREAGLSLDNVDYANFWFLCGQLRLV